MVLLDAVSLIPATLILVIPRSQALLRSKPSLMVGKLPQEDRMGTYGKSRSEKMTFFSRNLKGGLLLVNSRSTIILPAPNILVETFYKLM
jgi:hypothetical protein